MVEQLTVMPSITHYINHGQSNAHLQLPACSRAQVANIVISQQMIQDAAKEDNQPTLTDSEVEELRKEEEAFCDDACL